MYSTPADIIKSHLTSPLQSFFVSEIVQNLDDINFLRSLDHKRKLVYIGPGGVAKDHAGIEIRDVHPTHFRLMCMLNSPEGASIGLINFMAIYTSVNDLGFLETPLF